MTSSNSSNCRMSTEQDNPAKCINNLDVVNQYNQMTSDVAIIIGKQIKCISPESWYEYEKKIGDIIVMDNHVLIELIFYDCDDGEYTHEILVPVDVLNDYQAKLEKYIAIDFVNEKSRKSAIEEAKRLAARRALEASEREDLVGLLRKYGDIRLVDREITQ